MGKLIRLLLVIAIPLGVVIGALRLTAIRWWQIPDDDPVLDASLSPTLRGGDWVLLWRATAPKFGALVICPDPEDGSQIVMGRIVGEAGDTITVDGATVFLNGHEAGTETACAPPTFHVADPNTGGDVQQHCELEGMGGVLHMRGDLVGSEQVDVRTTRTVGEGKVYLISDNRQFPYDSRNFGSVDRSTCKESVFFRLVGKTGFMDEDQRLSYIR